MGCARTAGEVSGVLLAALLVTFAVLGSAWQWPIATVFAALALDAVLAPRRRSARVVTLDGDVPEPATA
ncbi:hypothetical protein [Cellulomonas sp. ATA003]|uniref:hypothetical protein n=1 Tax=Cellulomonas sp. ATA003 TaxID=3073064 RepID=UPI0028736904|nr:hypothetical protein [Cellulomonas sp. ATA003]WNB86707.1 hypothetical protein REH70_05640 [Cellulomonas sp. ATA003]